MIETSFQKRGVFDVNKVFGTPSKIMKKNGFKAIEAEVAFKGSERETKWIGSQKITHYIKLKLEVKMKAWNIKNMDVKGKKLQHASMRATIKGKLETDYNKKWEGSPWKEYSRTIKEKIFMLGEIKEKKVFLIGVVKDIREALKEAAQGMTK